ncbi:MAG TPA: right-handed parallel beta-helix repeat-containing protein [Bryobacteraceae bacterium]|nr:right-handed parallel beta-helix repeat-containing protein [Bryobacteraceae bacterium]
MCNLRAATWYVSPSGADANPGTPDQPFRTVAQGVAVAAPGDTILLADGIYGAEGHTEFAVHIRSSGTPTAWITLKAQNKGGAILDCQNVTDAPQTGCQGYIYLDTGAAYWVFQDLVFQHEYTVGIDSNSVPSAHDILVRGCRFEYIGQHPSFAPFGEAGFYAGPGGYNMTFDSNVFHDIGRDSGTYISHDHGLYLHSSSTTIVNNIFYAPITGWGVQTASGFGGLIANNTFALVMNNNGGQLMLWDNDGSITVRNNIFYNPNRGYAVNTSGFTTSGACSVDHNLVFGGTPGTVAPCSVNGNFTGDPQFVNASSPPYDFHLQAGSPAIGNGVPIPNLTYDFDGNPRPQNAPPDIGALQYQPPAAAQVRRPQQLRPSRAR